jgi:hypothetical protein
MVKRTLMVLAIFGCWVAPSYGASSGTVVKRISGCDYFMVSATSGYAILEWYGGHDPDAGDVLIGKIEQYGMHDIVDDTADENLTVWVEDYGDSRSTALEKLVDKCGD